MSNITDVFNELLYGSGGWLGLLIIEAVVIGMCVSTKSKLPNMIGVMITAFFGLSYLSNVTDVNSNLMWASIIMFLTSILVLVHGVQKNE